jgi:phosphoribosyl 1,2-cyclic phosphodiesterase
MLRFTSLGSGSTGNATLVEARDGTTVTRLLIDCGFNLKHLDLRLARAGLSAGDIDAIFITHEHGDHVGCAPQFAQRHNVPLWMSRGTQAALGLDSVTDLQGLLKTACDMVPIEHWDLSVMPFTVPHDAREPLQLRCSDGARRLGVLTDLGHATFHVLRQLEGCDALLLECNHDPGLLEASGYPPFLKRRVAGDFGHLSNTSAADIAARVQHAGLGHVVAAHLSQQNNRPELARACLATALGRDAADIWVADAEQGNGWLDV